MAVMQTLRQKLKQVTGLKMAVLCLRLLRNRYSVVTRVGLFKSYLADYRAYQSLPKNSLMPAEIANLYPCIYDKTSTTPLDPVYFYQDAWCAGKIFENKPAHHYDVASHAPTIGIISQFAATTMVDIRPLPISLAGLSFVEGSVLALPFADDSIDSLSSICVIEHIGLGRYGDPLDQFGSEKAARELERVLAPGGNLYISVPVDVEDRVYFNAHRAFAREYVLEIFKSLELVEEKYIYGNSLQDGYDPKRGFGTGLYHFKK